ncbi:hypothetical protein LWP59_31985 [Amycolatopsis acidiphila]|uniref:Uncharacterized protein n=2 Tax=Amycolatopsis acidiphila TaxID=715473 RepID=A0A558AHH4_9PSEU|nr:hypothetical protein [Amycolatopsis acidiphila]TVT23726.1 hypothetical protein FNH06_09300 [Amycolatopsis acidiphila]UIJ64029.1 hypothetical protein LWP59_31985 [Amycolatopsis acidiphila]GHG76078.1 hypothetical protein GCM10017788_41290 [Amycolatopsis acidiphila]
MSERAVHVEVQLRHVTVDAGGTPVSFSYPGILLTGSEDGEQVCERWVPFGDDPSDEDDERLVQALHQALLWQGHELRLWS